MTRQELHTFVFVKTKSLGQLLKGTDNFYHSQVSCWLLPLIHTRPIVDHTRQRARYIFQKRGDGLRKPQTEDWGLQIKAGGCSLTFALGKYFFGGLDEDLQFG